MKTLILGEIVVARIIKNGPDDYTVEIPASAIPDHVLGNNKYDNEAEAIQGAKFLVPMECRMYIKMFNR